MKKATPGKKNTFKFGNDANLEMLYLIYSFKLYICQDPRIARAYTAQNTKKRTSRLSRSASVRAFILWRAAVAGNVIWPMPCMPRLTPLAADALRCSGSRTGRGK